MIIVTGGAGFIGSGLVAQLNRRGREDILIVDCLGCDEKWKNLRKLRYIDYLEKDVFLEEVKLGMIPMPVEAIFHMGACSSTTEKDASFLAVNNYEYTKTLCQWAVNQGIQFVYASSAATYGDGEQGFADNESRLDELIPLNMYGYSKQMFDQWVKRQGLLDEVVGMKFFNVFGPNEYHKADMQSFILKSFEQIKAYGKVRLFKSHRPDYRDGEQVRDFIYIKDAVAMALYFLENKEVKGIFNIGTGKARSWNDLVKATFAAMGKKPVIEYIDMPESIREQYQYFTQADISKILGAGYKEPITSLEDAVDDYVKNYLAKNEYLGS
ncbi:MAG: ADP-glyceromanno-heptose 6-epimerase [Phycisphaerae bacterium]|nr:ADP-glyceromanno-heptose 6-epimerase [Phycisphaerae bacterium]